LKEPGQPVGARPSESPTVSVLLPVRDGAAHVAEAIQSILDQTLDDLELLVVDDGSRDGTSKILQACADGDERVRILSHTRSLGIISSLEHARREARGPYLARMDADDRSLPERLQAQMQLMESDPAMALCGVGIRYFPEALVRDGARRYARWLNSSSGPDQVSRERFVECPLAHPTFFMRADRVDAVGGYRDMGWPEDYDLLLRLHESGGRLGQVPETLFQWREGEKRLSRTHPRYSPGAFRACKVHFLRRGPLGGSTPALIWGAGPTGKAFGRALRAAGTPLAAYVDLDPRKIGQAIHGAPVISPDDLPGPGSCFALGAVGQAGARAEIRLALVERGWSEERHFLMVA